ncbi:Pentatricopeptide repeat-containing protein [Arachis hypogaea]|nr:Pentatricopeptide repeat-containing protein [Arachis hypogaea]
MGAMGEGDSEGTSNLGQWVIFNMIVHKDVISWGAVICDMAMNGHGKQALQLFSQMVVHDVAHNDVRFIGLLSAYSHEGMMSVGVMLFKAMAVEICGCWWIVNAVVCWRRESVGRREVVMAMVRGRRRGMW